MALRSSWEGFLKLNLLSVPVKAYSASVGGRGKIGFHQIHAGCGERIRHKKVCPVHGEVANADIVPGYEYAKGQYVVVEPGEIEQLRTQNEKAINIDVFIRPGDLDPVYYTGRTYYLAPDGRVGEKPYAVLQRVMSEANRQAVAQIVFSGREQLVLIRPAGRVLAMNLLYYADQVKKPEAFADEAPEVEPSAKEMQLAEALVEASTAEDFDFSRYHDEYETQLAELIEKKAKGEKITGPRAKREEPVVINLMDALRQSLDRTQKGAKKGKPRRTGGRKRKTG
jgi:DNA end-binding protein Ku